MWNGLSHFQISLGEAELRQLFEQKGGVESITVMRDLYSGKSRGFGFVEMSSEEATQKAITELNGCSVDGRAILQSMKPDPNQKGVAASQKAIVATSGADPGGNKALLRVAQQGQDNATGQTFWGLVGHQVGTRTEIATESVC